MLQAFIGAKGGVGTSSLAVMAASVISHRGNDALLVDLSGDLAVVLACDTGAAGLAEWSEAGELSLGAVDTLCIEVSPKVKLLSRGRGSIDPERLRLLWALLAGKPRPTFIDASSGARGLNCVRSELIRRTLVVSACYQAIYRGQQLIGGCDDLLVVGDIERALTHRDVEVAVGKQSVGTVNRNSAIGRLADGGRLLERGWRYVSDLPAEWVSTDSSTGNGAVNLGV